eukprot:scaffold406_cov57-Cylindrotheca_fusiformis.AAC.12
MEIYFANLLASSGAKELSLVRDDASSSRPWPKTEPLTTSVSYPLLGPPSCPRRQKSDENLVWRHQKSSKATQGKRLSSRRALNSFFDDVMPSDATIGRTTKPQFNNYKPNKKNARWEATTTWIDKNYDLCDPEVTRTC